VVPAQFICFWADASRLRCCAAKGPDVNDPSPDSAISELPKYFLSLFSPIEWHPAQKFLEGEVAPVFAG
jgi:hypothetical protein